MRNVTLAAMATVCAVGLAWASAAGSATACTVLDQWLAGQGADIGPGQCSVQVDPDGQVCRWDFPYRAAEAQADFDAMSNALAACAGPGGILVADQPVNHPDSYALHRYALTGRDVALSLKDKAALGKSLIFLRVSVAERP